MKENKTTKKNVKKNTKGKTNSGTKKKTTKVASSVKTTSAKKVSSKPAVKKQPVKTGANKNSSKKTVTKKQTPKTSEKIVVNEPKTPKAEIKKEVVTPKKEEIKPKNVKAMESADFGGDEIRKLLIIIGAVCAVMLAFYFITEVVVNNKKKEENKDNKPVVTEPVIQYEEILMGSLLNQNEVDYYVLVYDPEDPMLGIYNTYISSYKASDEPLKVYKVDLSKDYNKSYIAEESYLTGTDVSAVKVKGTTLVRVSAKSVYKSFEGKDAIIGRFKYMLNLD